MPRLSKVTRKDQRKGIRLDRPKKRPNPNKKQEGDLDTSGASAKKIKVNTINSVPEDSEKHYRIIDFLLVFNTLSTLVQCKQCGKDLSFKCCKKEGLGFEIQLKCDSCSPRYVPSCEKIGRSYEINSRFIFVMRSLGIGQAGCNKFCGLMDLTCNFLSKPSYLEAMQKICDSVKTTAAQFLYFAAQEEKRATFKNTQSDNLTVSGDGTWMKQGFSSLFGVTSMIGYWTGKVIDIFVSSLYCNLCKLWQNKLNTCEFESWHEEHVENNECQANHTGPSGNMETAALIEMFSRSEELYEAKIENYIGDGDTKSYGNLVKAKPYGENFTINKKECVGHVQKRMGARLRDIVNKTVEEKEVKTGKNAGKKRRSKMLGGKGKLTAKVIDNLSRYYGLAIRNNCDSVEKMKTAIWATYYHQQSTDENPQHDKCPAGADSWCGYQKALAEGKPFKHEYTPLPEDVLNAIKPIYEDLSKDELLERCLGGFTQNTNESLNQLIWRIAPKKLSGSTSIVQLAALVAACTFNEGTGALLQFMYDMGISIGPSAHEYARRVDQTRIERSDQKCHQQTKEGRIARRLAKKDAEDNEKASGNILYGAGIDDSV